MPTADTTADEQAIRQLQQDWMAATRAGEGAKVLTLMTDDALFLTPGRPPFGKEAFAAAAEAASAMKFAGAAMFEEVVIVGDVAYARGKVELEVTPPNGPARKLAGYTLTIFRKQPDGRWLLARDANFVAPVAS